MQLFCGSFQPSTALIFGLLIFGVTNVTLAPLVDVV